MSKLHNNHYPIIVRTAVVITLLLGDPCDGYLFHTEWGAEIVYLYYVKCVKVYFGCVPSSN